MIKAKVFFGACRRLDIRIDGKYEEIQRLRSIAGKCTASYSSEPRGGSSANSKVESAVLRLIALEKALDVRVDNFVNYKRLAQSVIARLSDDRYRDIITWRYFNGWGWGRIAEAMDCDRTWAWKLHGRALAEAQCIIDAECVETRNQELIKTIFNPHDYDVEAVEL